MTDTPAIAKTSSAASMRKGGDQRPAFLEFFAGSGLVAEGLREYFRPVWANDISEKKAAVYVANHGNEYFQLAPIETINGASLPSAELSWASFPCQDLSLAGDIGGIHAERSGLVWQWLRIMDEMPKRLPLLVAENVVGLVSAHGGEHYRTLHHALRSRGYVVGAMVVDAVHWVPQSRPRVFVVAVRKDVTIPDSLISSVPTWLHPASVQRAATGLDGWVWWNLPEPPNRQTTIEDIIEWDAQVAKPEESKRALSLVPERHKNQLRGKDFRVAPGYRRTRKEGQVLELRFDGVAGCLRTPEGGSSRQFLVIKTHKGTFETRALTVRETARLMGAPDSYSLPGTYNDGYRAMGDAVAVPVARYLSEHLLSLLSKAANDRAI